MLDVLDGFVAELRAAGIPVSLRETIDASDAVSVVGLSDRAALRSALAATLVKQAEHRAVFRSTFEVYFSVRLASLEAGDEDTATLESEAAKLSRVRPNARASRDQVEAEELRDLARDALRSGDLIGLTSVARLSVALFAGVDPARPVGVSYYLQRALRGLELEALLAGLIAESDDDAVEPDALATATRHLGSLGRRVRAEEYASRAAELRALHEAEIRRLLVEARGAPQVARSLRRPLIEDVDFIAASRDELAEMRRAIFPLARVLASRLSRRRRHRRRGPLDFRRTIRRSLSTGGVPLEPRFRSPHPAQPEIFVLADISGSVAAFARFTVHLVYAIASQFSKVRSVVFIDGVDEVTGLFRRSASLADAVSTIATDAHVVHGDGHSDYGSALRQFHARFAREINGRTNVIVLGDARNNYHLAEAWVLQDLQRRARRVYWLNPEPRSYWGSGDSIMEQYAPYCDGVYECRNLRQLKAFVDELA